MFQLYEYHKLNLLNEKFKVIRPHEFDMGNTGLMVSTVFVHLPSIFQAVVFSTVMKPSGAAGLCAGKAAASILQEIPDISRASRKSAIDTGHLILSAFR